MIRCIAVDDEELALELIVDNIKQVPFLELVGTCSTALEAIQLLQLQQVDLVFLDIQMPGLSGVQFLKTLPNPPLAIFITAYQEFALDGYDLNVVDYLLKPVSFERFLKACNKAYELHQLKTDSTKSLLPDYFFINSEYSLVKVVFKEILYVEGLKDYIKIYVENQKRPHITRMTMKAIEEKLLPYGFLRVHKSFIVALDKILSIRNLKITIGEAQIPISEQNIEELLTKIGSKKLS